MISDNLQDRPLLSVLEIHLPKSSRCQKNGADAFQVLEITFPETPTPDTPHRLTSSIPCADGPDNRPLKPRMCAHHAHLLSQDGLSSYHCEELLCLPAGWNVICSASETIDLPVELDAPWAEIVQAVRYLAEQANAAYDCFYAEKVRRRVAP